MELIRRLPRSDNSRQVTGRSGRCPVGSPCFVLAVVTAYLGRDRYRGAVHHLPRHMTGLVRCSADPARPSPSS